MPVSRYQYVILLCSLPGQEEEFDDWYDNQHLKDVMRVEGVVGASRYNIDFRKVTGFEGPPWRSLAIYEIESDDPMTVSERIRSLSGTAAMPYANAVTKSGMVQIICSAAGVPHENPLPLSDALPEGWSKTEPAPK